MDHLRGRHPCRLAREPRIGQIARMTAQEVIGHATADAVKFDALPDQPAPGNRGSDPAAASLRAASAIAAAR